MELMMRENEHVQEKEFDRQLELRLTLEKSKLDEEYAERVR